MASLRSRALALALSALAASCHWPATAMYVLVRTDMAWGTGQTLTELDLTVWPGSVDPGATAEPALYRRMVLGSRQGMFSLPGSFVLERRGGASAPVTIEVVAYGTGGELFRTRVVALYTRDQTVRLEIFLAGSCRTQAVTCASDQTCGRSGCESSHRGSLPVVTPMDLENGSDAGASGDGGTPLPTRPVAPLSTATVAARRPELRAVVGAQDVAPTSVRLCLDRAMTQRCSDLAVTSGGARAQPSADLDPGVWYWQLRFADPSRAAPVWQFTVPPRGTPRTNNSWGTTPDFNGDGLAELLVGSPDFSSSAGRVLVFNGAVAGPSTMPSRILTGDPAMPSSLGTSLASAGDLDGDGFPELVLGAPGARSGRGSVLIYRGGAQGLSDTPQTINSVDGGGFGQAVSSAGDVNGDGYADLLVGAPQAGPGHAYLYLGGPGGIGGEPRQVLNGTGGAVGSSVCSLYDVDGDGFSEVAVGAPTATAQGGLLVYQGTASGLGATPVPVPFPNTMVRSFGASLSSGGDVNGDGIADVVVGAPGGGGGAFVYHLGNGLTSFTASTSLLGGALGSNFGASLSLSGDSNGDGFADLLVGGPQQDMGVGRVQLYLGSAMGIPMAPTVRVLPPTGASSWGRAVALVGDFNGDGRSDLAASGMVSGSGQVHLYLPTATALGNPLTFSGGAMAATGFGAALALLDPRWRR